LVGPNAQNLVCDDVNKKNRPIGIPWWLFVRRLTAFCESS
jgi:hypothetical protein